MGVGVDAQLLIVRGLESESLALRGMRIVVLKTRFLVGRCERQCMPK